MKGCTNGGVTKASVQLRKATGNKKQTSNETLSSSYTDPILKSNQTRGKDPTNDRLNPSTCLIRQRSSATALARFRRLGLFIATDPSNPPSETATTTVLRPVIFVMPQVALQVQSP